MKIEVRCPYGTSQFSVATGRDELTRCNQRLVCDIDTTGDPSVGMQPSGLENVVGICVHADGINSDLENDGPDRVKVTWPTFSGALDDALDAHYRESREWESHDEEEIDNDHAV